MFIGGTAIRSDGLIEPLRWEFSQRIQHLAAQVVLANARSVPFSGGRKSTTLAAFLPQVSSDLERIDIELSATTFFRLRLSDFRSGGSHIVEP